ncbi:hypothetical protein [uncultured Phascolarctobacterium sp.]
MFILALLTFVFQNRK